MGENKNDCWEQKKIILHWYSVFSIAHVPLVERSLFAINLSSSFPIRHGEYDVSSKRTSAASFAVVLSFFDC